MPGPVPQTYEMEIAKGGHNAARKSNKMNMSIDMVKTVLPPPKELNKVGRAAWRTLMDLNHQKKNKVIANVDLTTLHDYCVMISQLDELRSEPVMIKVKGVVKRNPANRAYIEIVNTVQKIADKFGLNPAARVKDLTAHAEELGVFTQWKI